jgi:hypothetical protein
VTSLGECHFRLSFTGCISAFGLRVSVGDLATHEHRLRTCSCISTSRLSLYLSGAAVKNGHSTILSPFPGVADNVPTTVPASPNGDGRRCRSGESKFSIEVLEQSSRAKNSSLLVSVCFCRTILSILREQCRGIMIPTLPSSCVPLNA